MSNDTCPPIVSGSEPDPAEWLTVDETIETHFRRTPRKKKIHRSAPGRWAKTGKVEGCIFSGRLYISRASLEAYCAPRSARIDDALRPSDTKNADDAVKRMSRRHGVRTPKKGGDTR